MENKEELEYMKLVIKKLSDSIAEKEIYIAQLKIENELLLNDKGEDE